MTWVINMRCIPVKGALAVECVFIAVLNQGPLSFIRKQKKQRENENAKRIDKG
jgi:hypothetical protein